MTQRVSETRCRNLSFWHVLPALLLLWIGFSPMALANHGGPVIYVDNKNASTDDNDCNFHFKTIRAALTKCPLQEFGTIIVDPGTYNESDTGGPLTIIVKGLIIKSSGGAPRTKINGCFNVAAQKVEISGFDINGVSCDHGITVAEREANIHDNIIHESKLDGILVSPFSDESVFVNNNIFNTGGNGVDIGSDSHGIQLTQNRLESNKANGILLEGRSDRYNIANNNIDLNNGAGILILGADSGQITKNTIEANVMEGIKLNGSHDNVVVDNTLNANDLFGISLVGSDNNEVRSNTLTSNRAGGVALRGDDGAAQSNTVENNQITGNVQSGASGVLLEGTVAGSIVLKNVIGQNSYGVRLTSSQVSPGQPSNNSISQNEIKISDEDGVRIEASSGLNIFLNNQILNNNRTGVHVLGGNGNDEFAANTIQGNGNDGIRIENSNRNTIRENTISNNGGSNGQSGVDDGGAIVLSNSSSTTINQNTLQDGEANGLLMLQADSTKLFNNTIQRFQQDGVNATNSKNLFLQNNVIQSNRERGVVLSGSQSPDLEGNTISSNSLGGVFFSNSQNPHLQLNSIIDNLRYGMWVEQNPAGSSIEARRNWWGDRKGPSGVFEGRGNAVIMMGVQDGNSSILEQDTILQSVMPWLTDRVNEEAESSVTGFILQDFGPGKVELDATDHADVRVSLFSVAQEERGIAILAKYSSPLPTANSALAPSPLSNAIKAVSILTNGFGTGSAVIDINYSDSEVPQGVDKSALRLYQWTGSNWQPLTSKNMGSVNVIEGEIDVKLLRDGVIIAVAP
jgi:parallel beta-helix repeat protein